MHLLHLEFSKGLHGGHQIGEGGHIHVEPALDELSSLDVTEGSAWDLGELLGWGNSEEFVVEGSTGFPPPSDTSFLESSGRDDVVNGVVEVVHRTVNGVGKDLDGANSGGHELSLWSVPVDLDILGPGVLGDGTSSVRPGVRGLEHEVGHLLVGLLLGDVSGHQYGLVTIHFNAFLGGGSKKER